jgi:hypothetical protein
VIHLNWVNTATWLITWVLGFCLGVVCTHLWQFRAFWKAEQTARRAEK